MDKSAMIKELMKRRKDFREDEDGMDMENRDAVPMLEDRQPLVEDDEMSDIASNDLEASIDPLEKKKDRLERVMKKR